MNNVANAQSGGDQGSEQGGVFGDGQGDGRCLGGEAGFEGDGGEGQGGAGDGDDAGGGEGGGVVGAFGVGLRGEEDVEEAAAAAGPGDAGGAVVGQGRGQDERVRAVGGDAVAAAQVLEEGGEGFQRRGNDGGKGREAGQQARKEIVGKKRVAAGAHVAGIKEYFAVIVGPLEGLVHGKTAQEGAGFGQGFHGVGKGAAVEVVEQQYDQIAGTEGIARRKKAARGLREGPAVSGIEDADAFGFAGVESALEAAGDGLVVRGEEAEGRSVAEEMQRMPPAGGNVGHQTAAAREVVEGRAQGRGLEQSVAPYEAQPGGLIIEDARAVLGGTSGIEGRKLGLPPGIQVIVKIPLFQQDSLFEGRGIADVAEGIAETDEAKPGADNVTFMQQGQIHEDSEC